MDEGDIYLFINFLIMFCQLQPLLSKIFKYEIYKHSLRYTHAVKVKVIQETFQFKDIQTKIEV